VTLFLWAKVMDYEQKLEGLQRLREKGLIDEETYKARYQRRL